MIAVGDAVIGFNSREWVEAGHDQPEGNAQFFQEAVVERVYLSTRNEPLAELRWPDGRRSAGHFIDMLDVPASSSKEESR